MANCKTRRLGNAASGIFLALAFISVSGPPAPGAMAQTPDAPAAGSIIEGKLAVLPDGQPVLIRPGQPVLLSSAKADIHGVLRDSAIRGRVLRVQGRAGAGGRFEVDEFHIVRGEKLYRLIYFCDT